MAGAAGRRLLVKGGTVLTMDAALGDLERGDVLIDSGRIATVGAALQPADAEVIDATVHLIRRPQATIEDLIQIVPGPDFPTAAQIYGRVLDGLRCAAEPCGASRALRPGREALRQAQAQLGRQHCPARVQHGNRDDQSDDDGLPHVPTLTTAPRSPPGR